MKSSIDDISKQISDANLSQDVNTCLLYTSITAGDASDDTEVSEPSGTNTGSATEQTAQTEADTAAEEKLSLIHI